MRLIARDALQLSYVLVPAHLADLADRVQQDSRARSPRWRKSECMLAPLQAASGDNQTFDPSLQIR
jgi:hypothetical protein